MTDATIRRAPFLKKLPSWFWLLVILAILLGSVYLLAAFPESATLTGSSPFSSFIFGLSVLLKLGAVLVLIYISAHLFRNWRVALPGKVERQVVVLETTHLTARQALHLVQVNDRVVLLGATDQSLTLLMELDALDDQLQPPTIQNATGLSPEKMNSPVDFSGLIK